MTEPVLYDAALHAYLFSEFDERLSGRTPRTRLWIMATYRGPVPKRMAAVALRAANIRAQLAIIEPEVAKHRAGLIREAERVANGVGPVLWIHGPAVVETDGVILHRVQPDTPGRYEITMRGIYVVPGLDPDVTPLDEEAKP